MTCQGCEARRKWMKEQYERSKERMRLCIEQLTSKAKALTLGDDSTTEIGTTCLEEKTTATSDWGLTTPGEGSIQIDTDPKNLSHMKLLELAVDRAEVGVYTRSDY